MKDSCFMPRCEVYHSFVLEIETTVRTRWSRDLMVAAGPEDILEAERKIPVDLNIGVCSYLAMEHCKMRICSQMMMMTEMRRRG
jgi:hypothetical protein